MLSKEDIEKLAQQFDIEALARGAPRDPGRSRSQVVKAVSFIEIHGKRVEHVATPLEITTLENAGVCTRKLRIDQIREDCGIQSRELCFKYPVLVTETDVYSTVLPALPIKGRQRLQQNELPRFDLSWPFNGSKEVSRKMKDWGVKKSL